MTQAQVSYNDLNGNDLLDLEVFVDFLCPFSYQVGQWVNQINEVLGSEVLSVRWRFFSLEQSHRPDETWNIWEQKPENTQGLLAFLAGSAAYQVGGEAGLGKFYLTLGKLYHEDNLPVWEPATIEQAWETAGFDPAALAGVLDGTDRSGYQKLQEDHTEAVERHKAFGTPTLVFEEVKPFFLKLMPRPTDLDQALALFQSVQSLAMGFNNGVYEFKRTDL